MENPSIALVALLRTGNFPSLGVVEAVFIGSSLVRENDHPLRIAKDLFGSGLFPARCCLASQSESRTRMEPSSRGISTGWPAAGR